jgi:hypothetical protein
LTNSDPSIARGARFATWIALPAIGALAKRSPDAARLLLVALIGTIGIGHGANDDAILARLEPDLPGGRVTISASYGVLFTTVFALAMRFPSTAERGLAMLSVWHFGNGDAALARAAGSRSRSPFEALVRGLVPLTISSERMRAWRALPALGYAAFHAYRGESADALDVALPAVTLALTPAPFGFASYFGAWHAPRHLAVVLQRDERGGSARERFVRFVRESLRNLAISGIIGAVSYALLRHRDPHEIFVALTLGVTVPHEAAVWYAERAARRPKSAR